MKRFALLSIEGKPDSTPSACRNRIISPTGFKEKRVSERESLFITRWYPCYNKGTPPAMDFSFVLTKRKPIEDVIFGSRRWKLWLFRCIGPTAKKKSVGSDGDLRRNDTLCAKVEYFHYFWRFIL